MYIYIYEPVKLRSSLNSVRFFSKITWEGSCISGQTAMELTSDRRSFQEALRLPFWRRGRLPGKRVGATSGAQRPWHMAAIFTWWMWKSIRSILVYRVWFMAEFFKSGLKIFSRCAVRFWVSWCIMWKVQWLVPFAVNRYFWILRTSASLHFGMWLTSQHALTCLTQDVAWNGPSAHLPTNIQQAVFTACWSSGSLSWVQAIDQDVGDIWHHWDV